jgi:hypothetical protein
MGLYALALLLPVGPGLWDFPFDKADTFDGPFITSTGQIVQVGLCAVQYSTVQHSTVQYSTVQ